MSNVFDVQSSVFYNEKNMFYSSSQDFSSCEDSSQFADDSGFFGEFFLFWLDYSKNDFESISKSCQNYESWSYSKYFLQLKLFK